ncbi:MAG: cation transporter [Candidatus Omnitrophica bacterium CG07_land_8_20_14_0_80_42_15]|uniref:Cation transporter n=1 Tax=Candidatus Aquitaenariimonas noxiae TaxID=1974741 RepID=A0A2J0KW48_9BACT|nr:MAG: cation transporter [Candidatus Omnitrophica bacterium CG07_land_8_20_14_0_80_42_15]
MELKGKLRASALNEKQHAATNSVIAAFCLTGFKIVVGLVTGSLGILAEAAHSGLDLIAAAVTAFAVNKSGKPADREHHYGHGKIENISAFFETILLLVTCFWIISEAIRRIMSGRIEIEVNVWSFIVMATSIFIDISRSKMLYDAAKKFKSQALEADALHFSTDVWSSAVVILGLFCVKLSEWLKGYEFLHYADTIAAIFVGLIMIQVSIRLGMRTIDALLDAAPKGIDRKIISIVETLPNIIDCHNVRVRSIGHECFIDLHIHVNGNLTLQAVHNLTEEIESAIHKFIANADITIHPEPK